MIDAKQAFDEAKANGTNAEIDKAERAYIRAERQYRYRKHDVELNNWEVETTFQIDNCNSKNKKKSE